MNKVLFVILFFSTVAAYAGQVGSLKTFVSGAPAVAADVNSNFDAVKSAVNDNDTRLQAIENSHYKVSGPNTTAVPNGVANSKTLTFTKKFDSTTVKITWVDYIYSGFGSVCDYEILIDANSCPSGKIGTHIYTLNNNGAGVASGRTNTTIGYCDGLSAGTHTITINTSGSCTTGGSSFNWLLEAQELGPSQ